MDALVDAAVDAAGEGSALMGVSGGTDSRTRGAGPPVFLAVCLCPLLALGGMVVSQERCRWNSPGFIAIYHLRCQLN